jgi:hypothetical protein
MLNPVMMSKITVTTPGRGNVGLLTDGGRLRWPPLLKSPTTKKIDEMLPKAVTQTAAGDLDSTLYLQLSRELSNLKEEWRKKFHQEIIDGGTYVNGKHYLDSLESAVLMLPQPGTAELLSGSQGARGSTVQELVMNMTSQGLSFAPASPGNESAYYALQNALVTYARGAQTDSAFQMRLSPPPISGSAGGAPR